MPYGNLVVRPDAPAWQHYLQMVAARHRAEGYDGLFLDTLGDIEDPQAGSVVDWLVPAAANLVASVRSWIGEGLLVINNAIADLGPLVSGCVDGFAWEVGADELPLRSPWAQAVLDVLGRSAALAGTRKLLITSIPPGPVAASQLRLLEETARRFGFIAYAAPCDYAQGIRLPDGHTVLAPKPPRA